MDSLQPARTFRKKKYLYFTFLLLNKHRNGFPASPPCRVFHRFSSGISRVHGDRPLADDRLLPRLSPRPRTILLARYLTTVLINQSESKELFQRWHVKIRPRPQGRDWINWQDYSCRDFSRGNVNRTSTDSRAVSRAERAWQPTGYFKHYAIKLKPRKLYIT